MSTHVCKVPTCTNKTDGVCGPCRHAADQASNPKIYLAGPMTGLPDHNFPAFHEAAARLRELGHRVVNPAELDEADGGPGKHEWEFYIRRDLAELLRCQQVAVLEGWSDSRGARLEVYVAATVGIPVVWASTLEPLARTGLFRARTEPEPDPPESPLLEAESIVNGARRGDYGHPLDNHTRTAELWSAYVQDAVSFTAEDVCFLNILQKISRAQNRITRDTIVDIAGYAANIGMIKDARASS